MNRIIRAADALGVRRPKNVRAALAKLAALLVALSSLTFPGLANAATLSAASVALSDPQPSATASYNFTASGFTTATPIKCIKELYTVNSDGTGGTPTSMTNASTALNASSTLITPANWTDATTTAGRVVYHYTTGESAATSGTFNLDSLHSSSAPTTSGYWLTFSTWDGDSASGDCTGSMVDSVTVGFFITAGSQLSLTVNGTLSFSVNGITTSGTCSDGATAPNANSTATTIPFGTVAAATQYEMCQRLNAATNATSGYTIYLRYDHKPQNALSQTIGDFSPGTNNAPATFTSTNTGSNGQGAYGYSTDDQTLTGTAGTGAGQNNRFTAGTLFAAASTTNSEVGYESVGVSSTDYVVTHAIETTLTTQPGTYTNTIIYTCTPVY